jgi:DNA-binding PadR family transcriptional regulator
MQHPERISGAFLDILEHLIKDSEELHGFGIIKSTKRSPATVYRHLDRLEDMGWVTSRWENPPPEGRPSRHLFELTAKGRAEAQALLSSRRPRKPEAEPATVQPSPKRVPFGRRLREV